MKSKAEIYDYCVEQVCRYYATHRDLADGAAGIIEPHEVVCTGEDENYKDGHAIRISFVTKSADGVVFLFTAVPVYDGTKVSMEVYRAFDMPREFII